MSCVFLGGGGGGVTGAIPRPNHSDPRKPRVKANHAGLRLLRRMPPQGGSNARLLSAVGSRNRPPKSPVTLRDLSWFLFCIFFFFFFFVSHFLIHTRLLKEKPFDLFLFFFTLLYVTTLNGLTVSPHNDVNVPGNKRIDTGNIDTVYLDIYYTSYLGQQDKTPRPLRKISVLILSKKLEIS